MALEEIRRRVILSQILPLAVLRHRGELAQVAYEQELHSAERLDRIPQRAQQVVDCIQHIGAHHRNFIYDDKIKSAYDIQFLLAEPMIPLCLPHITLPRDIWSETQLKERMQSASACIDCRHASGGKHHMSLQRGLAQRMQKRSLTGASLAGKKKIDRSLIDDAFCRINQIGMGSLGIHIANVMIIIIIYNYVAQ